VERRNVYFRKVFHDDVSKLDVLLDPKSIAIIGASRSPGKVGHAIMRNLIEYGFSGDVYPINPHCDEIMGYKCYPSITSVEGDVDVCIVSVPAPLTPSVVSESGRKGVKVAIVISSGFKEVGNILLERELVETARRYGVRIIGPNVFGYVYTPKRINATFGPKEVVPGNIALISQSGALGVALMSWTIFAGIGVSAIFSVGNKADVDDADLLQVLEEDPHTNVVVIYMEGLESGRKFMEAARRISARKPVVVIKAGRTEAGARAVVSHTGSLAGLDVVYSTAFRQCGVLRALTIEEAFDWAKVMSKLPRPRGDSLLIITNGGGVGVLATDAAIESGLKVPENPRDLAEKFRKYMPPFGSARNPVDLTGLAGPAEYAGAVRVALEDDRVENVVVLYCETGITHPVEVAKAIVDAINSVGLNKPVVAGVIGGSRSKEAVDFLERSGIPTYPIPERAVSSLASYIKWSMRAPKLGRVTGITASAK